MEQKGKVCILTGHRVISQEHISLLPDVLDTHILAAYEMGCRTFWTGGALGFDRMAGDSILRLKNSYPDIRFGILVPCRDQDKSWREQERDAYRYQLAAADMVEVLAEAYYDGCMRVRNQALVDRADVCLSYVLSTRSGAHQTVKLAEQAHLPVINLAYMIY